MTLKKEIEEIIYQGHLDSVDVSDQICQLFKERLEKIRREGKIVNGMLDNLITELSGGKDDI